jgi:uncharacterized tellurite resistance protein B-like protein
MARSKDKNSWMSIFIGPAIVFFATVALWKNEHRFDYHQAAKATQPIESVETLSPDQLFSYTGSMDRDLTMSGRYVESMTGFLTVKCRAEIYAWEEDEDEDGTTWSKRWSSSVENNSRNNGLEQRLSSHRVIPKTFEIDTLLIETERMEFVDTFHSIPPGELNLSKAGLDLKLEPQSEYFYLDKGASGDLGDERVSYRGLPVPEHATYFGKFGKEHAVAHQAEVKEHFLNKIIKDTGVLHHLVAGDRLLALSTMKGHIARLKWIVRGVGLVATVLGFSIFFGFFVRFLVHIPVLGNLVSGGVTILSLVFGLTLGLSTILIGFVTSNPIVLGLIVASFLSLFFILRRKAGKSQQAIKADLDQQLGHIADPAEIKELEFKALVSLAMADGKMETGEQRYLKTWAKQHGWDEDKTTAMIKKAQVITISAAAESSKELLLHLIRLSLADGTLKSHELKTIRKAGEDCGYSRKDVQTMITQVRQAAGRAA